MTTHLIPTDFANIQTALASPLVVNGDILELEPAHTETYTTSVIINKAITIRGTSGNVLSTNPINNVVEMFQIAVPWTTGKVRFEGTNGNDIIINHLKSAYTNGDRMFHCQGNMGMIPDWLELKLLILNHLEHAVFGRTYRFRGEQLVVNISANTNNNANEHFHFIGSGEEIYINEVLYNAYNPFSGGAKTSFVLLTGNANYPICNGTNTDLTISNCEYDGSGLLRSGFYIERFDFWDTPNRMNLFFQFNEWTTSTNGGLGCYRFNSVHGETNILNNFNNIKFKTNSHNTQGFGMLSVGGTGALRALGAIQSNWILCNNAVTGAINDPSFSTYHFGLQPPSNNLIFGIENNFINTFPNPNPYQTYIDCSAGGFLGNYMLKNFDWPKKERRYYGVLL